MTSEFQSEKSCSRSVRLILTSDELIACNTGKAFSPAGLRAICAARLSNKDDDPFRDRMDADRVIEEIRQLQLDVYQVDPARLIADVNEEKDLRSDYSERVLFELLQNADDAMGPLSIGNKGIGFKGVIALSDAPRIYSGRLSLRFDSESAQQLLVENNFLTGGAPAPIMRFPFSIPEGSRDSDLVEQLRREFSTVIVLPFRSESDRLKLEKRWNDLQCDAGLPVFLNYIENLVWRSSAGEYQIRCERIKSGGVVRTFLDIPDGEILETEYHLIKDNESASQIAVPERTRPPILLRNHEDLRCFFPIQREANPFPRLILHGEFSLGQNRETILEDQLESSTAIDGIANCICSLAAKTDSLETLLNLLKPAVHVPCEELRGTAKRIWTRVREKLQNLPVPGCARLKIGDLRLLPEMPHVSVQQWEDREFAVTLVRRAVKGWFEEHRPGGLQGLPFVEEQWEYPERERTLSGLIDGCRLDRKGFRSLRLFPAQGQPDPICSAEFWLSFPIPGDAIQVPAALPIRFLPASASEALTKGSKQRAYIEAVGGISNFDFEKAVQEGVLPALDGGKEIVEPRKLLELLLLLAADRISEPPEPDPGVRWRQDLSAKCLVPVISEGSSFAPANMTFAGEDWTGDGLLDSLYGSRADQSRLSPPPADEGEREAWEKLYRFLGVAFCPRVTSVPGIPSSEEPQEDEKSGLLWDQAEGIFPLNTSLQRWSKYCEAVAGSAGKFHDYFPRLQKNWMLDIEPSGLEAEGAWQAITSNWMHYARFFKAGWCCSSKRGVDRGNSSGSGASFLLWLLQESRWVPVSGGEELRSVADVYRKGGSIARAMKESVPVTRTAISNDVAKVLSIPGEWSDLDPSRWKTWLERALQCPCEQQGFRKFVGNVYRAFLDHSTQELTEQEVWTEIVDFKGNADFEIRNSRDQVYYLDRPDLEDLRFPNIHTFPVVLGNFQKKAANCLGIEPLSSQIQYSISGEVEVDSNSELTSRIGQRLPHLSFACCGSGSENADRRAKFLSRAGQLKIRVVNSFSLDLQVGGKAVLEQDENCPYFHDVEAATFWVTTDYAFDGDLVLEQTWNQVAAALAMTSADSDLAGKRALMSNLLRVESDKDLFSLLRSEGVSEDELEEFDSSLPLPEEQRGLPSVPVDGEEGDSGVDAGLKEVGANRLLPASEVEIHGAGESEGDDVKTLRRSDHSTPVYSDRRNENFRKQRRSPSSKQNRADQGSLVEIAFCEKLKQRLVETDWDVPDYTVVQDGGEIDVLLSHPRGAELRLEVKSAKNGEFFWSEGEIKVARRYRDSYVLIIVRTQEGNRFDDRDVFIVSDPLEWFARHEKFVRWSPLDEHHKKDGWAISPAGPDPKRLRHSFKVRITEGDYQRLPSGLEPLVKRLSELVSPK